MLTTFITQGFSIVLQVMSRYINNKQMTIMLSRIKTSVKNAKLQNTEENCQKLRKSCILRHWESFPQGYISFHRDYKSTTTPIKK